MVIADCFTSCLDDALVGVQVRVPRGALVLDRILGEADAGQARVVERRGVRAARGAAARRGRADDADVLERLQEIAQIAGGLLAGRTRRRHARGRCRCRCSCRRRASRTPASAPRTSRSAPSRTPAIPGGPCSSPLHSATRIVRRGWTPIALRIRAASIITAQPIGVVGRARCRVPRVEVAAEHHDLVLLVADPAISEIVL